MTENKDEYDAHIERIHISGQYEFGKSNNIKKSYKITVLLYLICFTRDTKYDYIGGSTDYISMSYDLAYKKLEELNKALCVDSDNENEGRYYMKTITLSNDEILEL